MCARISAQSAFLSRVKRPCLSAFLLPSGAPRWRGGAASFAAARCAGGTREIFLHRRRLPSCKRLNRTSIRFFVIQVSAFTGKNGCCTEAALGDVHAIELHRRVATLRGELVHARGMRLKDFLRQQRCCLLNFRRFRAQDPGSKKTTDLICPKHTAISRVIFLYIVFCHIASLGAAWRG